MSNESLATRRPEQPLSEQLYELAQKEHETRAAFLGKAAVLAEEFGERPLSEQERNYANQLVPAWKLYTAKVRSIRMGAARRSILANEEQWQQIGEQHQPPRRTVRKGDPGKEDGPNKVIFYSARSALTGSDIASIFRIEQAYNAPTTSPIPVLPNPVKRRQKVDREKAKLHEPSGLRLTSSDREVLAILALSNAKIAEKLKIKNSSASKRISYAAGRNGISRSEFLVRAVDGGLVNMSLLPPRRSYTLTDNDKKLLKDYIFAGLETTAEGLGLASNQDVADLRQSINRKLGITPEVRTQTHMLLVAKRDGVI